MKEEMCRLYELTDYQQAVVGWTKWFQAAKESEIPALVRFAVQKEKRLPGLTAMPSTQSAPASSKASTTRSRSLNESATVTLIRYLSIPSVRSPFHKKS